jgi:hypothetical protein
MAKLGGVTVDLKKMVIAVVVAIVATAAAVAATAHSQRVLQQELHSYPPGTLKLGQSAVIDGVEVRVDGADVLESVASLGTRGYGMETLVADRRFLRLSIYLRNKSDKPVSARKLLRDLRAVRMGADEVQSTRVVWLRGYDALSPDRLGPAGSQTAETAGKVTLDVSSFALSLSFLVEVGDGKARWGVDVVDHNATEAGLLR